MKALYSVFVVALCVLINVIDGFDILALSFAAPVIVREWGLTPEQTGIVFSANLLGIGVGAFVFALAADLLGRRPVILFGTLLMSLGMLATSTVDSIPALAACRIVTGLGIGAMVSTAGTLAIEYSTARWRKLSVALVVIGYPIGGALGGPVAGWLLAHQGWRPIFLFGGLLTVALWPVLWWRLPESRSLPSAADRKGAAGQLAALWQPAHRRATLLLCAMYPLYMFTFYFFVNWHTKLATERGLSVAEAVQMSSLWSLTGIAGGVLFGLVATRLPLTRLVASLAVILSAGIASFGLLPAQPLVLDAAALVLGFFMWGASATIFSVIALSYPVGVRASGIGLVVTVGRVGSALGPWAAGLLRGAGHDWSVVAPLLAVPGVLAALLILLLRPENEAAAVEAQDQGAGTASRS
jgi:MFS family permease